MPSNVSVPDGQEGPAALCAGRVPDAHGDCPLRVPGCGSSSTRSPEARTAGAPPRQHKPGIPGSAAGRKLEADQAVI